VINPCQKRVLRRVSSKQASPHVLELYFLHRCDVIAFEKTSMERIFVLQMKALTF
jgi:hypothetical protein